MFKLEPMAALACLERSGLKPPKDYDLFDFLVTDLSGIWGDLESRRTLAAMVRKAVEDIRFFTPRTTVVAMES